MSEPAASMRDRPSGPIPSRHHFGRGKIVAALAILTAVAATGYATRDRCLPTLLHDSKTGDAHDPKGHAETAAPSEQVLLSAQAQKNLRLIAKPLKPEAFWKTIGVPGMVIDRPGFSDRGVVAPVTGVVARIH